MRSDQIRDASVERLIDRLDAAASLADSESICAAVKRALVEEIGGGLRLPAELLRPSSTGYARHLLHRGSGYAAVVMVWGPGQGTPIHDHDGHWCVECVYQGEIQVVSYDLTETIDEHTVVFRCEREVAAGKGMAGALIPPFDYHVIENRRDLTAVTLHIYGGEMQGCHAFVPLANGQYRKVRRQLGYS
ncbi:MAG: cysteine dioxygenase family protein [Planctomycetes bacterium]|nr:cysteine dioxygenase family protein [Planctomycetota bacterium]MCB9870919.1 cysteine dioxygenase family protein [Planctomycetota bacterium]MCB9889727.1 cysteine dioxygenase family protein [Planctomycetota bacterium]